MPANTVYPIVMLNANAGVPECRCHIAFDTHLTTHCCRLLNAVAVCWCILDLVLHGDVCCHGCRIYLLHDLLFEDMMQYSECCMLIL